MRKNAITYCNRTRDAGDVRRHSFVRAVNLVTWTNNAVQGLKHCLVGITFMHFCQAYSR